LLGLGREFYVWTLASFLRMLLLPTLNGSSQTIWQTKVAPDVQGRVFAARRLVAQVSAPVAMFLAGPLADQVFELGMMPAGNLASVFGWLVGTSQGAGLALMFVISGVLGMFVGLGAYAIRAVRCAEEILPDYDAKSSSEKSVQNQ